MIGTRHWLHALALGVVLVAVACRSTESAAPSATPVAAPVEVAPTLAPAATPAPATLAPTAARPAPATLAPTAAGPAPTSTQIPLAKVAPTATAQPKAPRVIAVDPGHGGSETGAVHTVRGGKIDLIEKDVNLAIALSLAEDLRLAGYTPVLTRSEDTGVNIPPRDLNGDGVVDVDDDLQARVDVANRAGASLLLSIHNNGAGPARRGTTTYYSEQTPPLGAQGRSLAGFIQNHFISGLRGVGYDEVIDEGISDDAVLGKPFGHLFVIGPKTPRVARAAKMPGALGETLFVTNDMEAALLATRPVQQAIALAYARGVDDYFADFPE